MFLTSQQTIWWCAMTDIIVYNCICTVDIMIPTIWGHSFSGNTMVIMMSTDMRSQLVIMIPQWTLWCTMDHNSSLWLLSGHYYTHHYDVLNCHSNSTIDMVITQGWHFKMDMIILKMWWYNTWFWCQTRPYEVTFWLWLYYGHLDAQHYDAIIYGFHFSTDITVHTTLTSYFTIVKPQ